MIFTKIVPVLLAWVLFAPDGFHDVLAVKYPNQPVHLRQEHGFKRWQTGRFKETYPWLIREDDTFAFAALHYLVHVMVHVEEATVPLDESGTVAFVRLIKPPGGTDHLHP